MRRSALVLIASLVVTTGCLTVAADASSGAPNNVVLVSSTADNPSNAGSHVQVASYGGDTLDSTNLARADSHDCTGCRTVAVAVQAVFGTGNPSTVQPTNLAIATNENCTGCATFAYAYQYVLATSGPIYLTTSERDKLAELRGDFRQAANNSNLSFPDLEARLQQLSAEFQADVDAFVQHDGQTPNGVVRERVDET